MEKLKDRFSKGDLSPSEFLDNIHSGSLIEFSTKVIANLFCNIFTMSIKFQSSLNKSFPIGFLTKLTWVSDIYDGELLYIINKIFLGRICLSFQNNKRVCFCSLHIKNGLDYTMLADTWRVRENLTTQIVYSIFYIMQIFFI